MNRAFSLIELLVVISIFSLISLTVLANHSRFQSSVLLEGLAYDIAISVRQAQVYGLSVRESTGQFSIGYGVHFAKAQNTSFILFTDLNDNDRYDAGTDTVVETYALGRGHTIARFCAETSTGIQNCSDTGTLTYLDILFFRPDPDATFSTNVGTAYSRGLITIVSAAGEDRLVTVASTGQISVSNP